MTASNSGAPADCFAESLVSGDQVAFAFSAAGCGLRAAGSACLRRPLGYGGYGADPNRPHTHRPDLIDPAQSLDFTGSAPTALMIRSPSLRDSHSVLSMRTFIGFSTSTSRT